jgi:hypothetical protein
MSDGVVVLRLSQKQATFLQANLALLATTTRQAMNRPGLESERRTALGSRAVLLETIEDSVRGAMLETPQAMRKLSPRVDMAAQTGSPRALRNFGRLSAA